MINEKALCAYLLKEFKGASDVNITKLGSGVQGSGFLVSMKTTEGERSYVVKGLFPEGLGHDYPSDRAGVFLLDLDEYGNLPGHVKAIDVLAEMEDGTVKSIGGGREYYLLMERGEGRHYFHDLARMALKERLDQKDIGRIRAMTSYLADIHSLKKQSRALYWRKLRDTIGHGECLMGVFDTYPDGVLAHEQMAAIEKKCVDWRARLKPRTERLCRIHGDFHPGNIWFGNDAEFVLLDRSRGPWGEPADDITALTINYVFFSIKHRGDVGGACFEALKLFFREYISCSGDAEITEVTAPFFAFRAAVVANPVFYPDVTPKQRSLLFRFCHGVLDDATFRPEAVNSYLR